MRFPFALAIALLLAGCDDWSVSNASAAKSAVKAKLTDPESAQFRNLRNNPSGSVCGEVNAKNRMGGYVGFQPFFYGTDGSVILESGVEIAGQKLAKFMCPS